jgi:hypothetical protein
LRQFAAGALVLGGAVGGALLVWAMAPHAAEPAGASAKEVSAAGPLHLDARAREQDGIRVAAVEGITRQSGRDGFARGVDLAPLAAIASDIATAEAASVASGREAARLASLAGADQSAARKDVEAARAQAVADRAKLAFSCQRVTLEFGEGLGRLGCRAIAPLVREAAAGRAALVRIDIVGQALPVGASVEIGGGDGSAPVRVPVLGPAAAGDPQLQTAGVLALLNGPGAARMPVGRVVSAHVGIGSATTGVLIPREAIVRNDGGMFVYRDAGADGFERIGLDDAEPVEGGWFVSTDDILPGDRIVVSGAGTLLGLERAAPAGGD